MEDQNIKDRLENKEEQKFKSVEYTDLEVKYRSELIQKMTSARDHREEKHDELNGMTYTQWYDENRKNSYNYLKPRKSKTNVSITTGTTKTKVSSILNTLLNYNMEPNINAYDKDDVPLNSLGYAMEAMVKKSRELEMYDEKRRVYYLEYLSQGTCYANEMNPKYELIDKELKDQNWISKDPKDIKWVSKVFKNYNQCESSLIEGKKVFLGDIKQNFLKKQPYAFITEYIPYDVAESMFKQFKRWENVPKRSTENFISDSLGDDLTQNWRLYTDQFPNYVEVIAYQDPWKNEYQLLLNGVMMMPVGFPLSYFTKDFNKFTFSKGDADPIPNFAYSRSIPADTKVSQEILDELLSAFIRKTRKSIDPPQAKKGGKKVSKKIFEPKNIAYGVDPDTIKEIGKNPGITSSEVSMYNIMQSTVNEMTVSSQFSNPGEDDSKTATQAQLENKQNLNKIGNALLGVILLEKQMVEHRIPNIIANWTEKQHKGLNDFRNELRDYRKITQQHNMGDEDVLMDIRLVDKEPNLTSAGIWKEEQELTKRNKKETRVFYIKASQLREYKYIFKTEIVPVEKDTDELRRLMFVNNIKDAVAIFGQQSINFEALKNRFAQIIKEDPEVFFNKQNMGMEIPGQGMPPGTMDGSSMKGVEQQMGSKKPEQPSVNTLKGN